jgi:pyridinium-3,5-bisthiocarboxylic acid mononucleotide nickel chelatase
VSGGDRPGPGTLTGGLFDHRAPAASELRGQHLHIDCASGAAGDMMLGALLDLGVPLEAVGAALDAIGAGRGRLALTRVIKGGLAALDVKVDTTGHILEHHHHGEGAHGAPGRPPRAASEPSAPPRGKRADSEPSGSGRFVAIKFRAETHDRHVHVDELGDKVEEVHERPSAAAHAHYHYADIRWRIARAPLSEGTRTRALDIFDRLARAEAKLHGTTIDSIVDVVGTAAALDWLAPASVTCAAVAMGHGTVSTAHGKLPVPAPAALEVLREAGGVMLDGGLARELCTPTGAAILASAVTAWTPAPPGRPVAVGWGAGDAELTDRPNAVRAVVLAPERAATTPGVGGDVWQIDANLDDMSPELCGAASDALFAAGALDVWWTPITMKKGRPALTLSALAEPAVRDAVVAAILRETTTIGVRFAPMQRVVLARRIVPVDTRYGTIPVKVALDGELVRNAAPEYEACAAAARAHGVPVKLVLAAALAAYAATGG